MKSFYFNLLSVVIIACIGIIIYSNSNYCSFHFDDFASIVNNPYIRHLHNLRDIWYCLPRRFILYLSIAFNYHFSVLEVYGYHKFNLGVHLISAILTWWLVLLTFSTPAMKEQKISRHASTVSLFAGLVFIVHPLQTEAVTYIVQRTASMATLFYLLSLCLYIKSRLDQDGNWKIYYTGALIAAIVAMFTKETAITLPLMILLYEYCFLKTKRGFDWGYLAPFLLTIFIIPVIMLFTETGAARVQQLRNEPGISSFQYLMTEFRVIVTYIRLLFIPINQNLDYAYPISKGFFELPTLASFLFLAGILYAAKKLFLKYRLVSFSIFWFFLTLLPESSILPIHDVIFEHRLYLPMVGFGLFLASGMCYLSSKDNIRILAVALTLMIVSYGFLTYQRNKVWIDEFTLWDDVVQKSPHKARVFINRGLAYYNQGNLNQAILDYSKAIVLKPSARDEYYNRGVAYDKQRNFAKAISDYDQAIKLDPMDADAYYNLGNAYFKEGNFTEAISDYDKAIRLDPKGKDEYNNRGLAYAKEGNFIHAIADYNKAVEFGPQDPAAYRNLALIYYQLKQYEQSWMNVHQLENLGYPVSTDFIGKLKKESGMDK